jgi:FkbM family methyltransferase
MYSQNDEEKYILEFFNNLETGKFLDIGSYDGVRFSNTYALVLKGWKGKEIEPSKHIFPKLQKNLKDFKVELVNKAVGLEDGQLEFWDSDDAVSTFDEEHKNKWEKKVKFDKIKVEVISLDTLLNEESDYDFINLDVEGLNFELFKNIPFEKLTKLKLICVEHDKRYEEMLEIIKPYGFKQINLNRENVIFGRCQ